jgi:prophage maintenance system killer protein
VRGEEFDSGDVLAIHVDIMGRLGKWPSPLRDESALDKVLRRVEAGRLEGVDAIRRAAILAVGLVQERPFEDGNLPTAFATLESYLSINGLVSRLGSERRIGQFLRVVAEEYDAVTAILALEDRLRQVVAPE